MLVQKLTWITLLMFLCQHGAEAKTVICVGNSAHLYCILGLIKVRAANYERTDGKLCPGVTQACPSCAESSLSTMSARCDGTKSCTVPAVNSVFSDPCVGTCKCLAYDCIKSRRSVTCENKESVISCVKGTGVITVHYANYGRRDLVTCPHQLVTTADCYSPQTSILGSRCNGMTSCELSASNSVFSDPCHGVPKYLEVMYSCG